MTSKIFVDKFSFQDLLAYFFPGIAIILGIVVLAVQFEFISFTDIKISAFTGILLFIIGFILGITLSGVSNLIVSFFYFLTKMKKPEQTCFFNESLESILKNDLLILALI